MKRTSILMLEIATVFMIVELITIIWFREIILVIKIRFCAEKTDNNFTLVYEDDQTGVLIDEKEKIFNRGVGSILERVFSYHRRSWQLRDFT